MPGENGKHLLVGWIYPVLMNGSAAVTGAVFDRVI